MIKQLHEVNTINISSVMETTIERAILVSLETSGGRMINLKSESERSLDELEELSETAGVTVIQKILQRRPVKDSAYYIGKGKVEELKLIVEAEHIDVVIFDDELSGAQFRNIEKVVDAKVIDRTTLILDIFARRARSREGKLQVELAQLKYRLPRLIGLGTQLSRLGGGIGTRGPGEKKLEVDRRHIRRRIRFLEKELSDIGKRRGLIREGRKKQHIPTIAVVGYTNAGKSTLMNVLCNADVFAEDKLFATLDPTTRKLDLPDGRSVFLIDTVGFIRKLPHELIEAFKSTLEEAVYADMLLHVVDTSDEEAEVQAAVADEILKNLGALNKPVILVLNKIDVAGESLAIPALNYMGEVFEVSAVTGEGLVNLKNGIARLLPLDKLKVTMIVPYSAGWVLPYLHEHGEVRQTEYVESGISITAEISTSKIERIKEYLV